jgi:hypothetical protein
MRRREFIALVGGAAAPLAAGAQQATKEPTMPTVGFLGPATAAGFESFLDGFRQGLGAS